MKFRFPWWTRSWTVWTGVAGFILCWIPATRQIIHQAELGVVEFQAVMAIVLRFKTEGRETRLSEIHGPNGDQK